MKALSFRAWSLGALPFLLLPAAACSSSPVSTGTGTAGSGAATTAAAPDPQEAARVQTFLDGRYKTTDVRYSFHTRAGQDIDCVDFFAEPGVKALAAQGKALTAIPETPPLPEALRKRAASTGSRPEDDLAFHGQLDENGNPEQCPAGSVPEVRITADDIARSGGLDAFSQRFARKQGPPRVMQTEGGSFSCAPDYTYYGHVVGTLATGQPGLAYGSTVMSVYGPNVQSGRGDHSLSQLWLYGGSNTVVGGTACTSDCVQSVEVGWTVDNSLDYPNTHSPYLFLFSTNNGYADGCYDNWNGVPSTCVTWVPSSTAAFAWNQLLAFDAPGNVGGQDPQPGPVEITPTVIEIGGNYWITITIGSVSSYLGYFPGSDFTGTTPFDTFQVGGEVYDATGTFTGDGVQMGSGNPPSEGYGWAAYHHDFATAWEANGSTQWSFDASMCATRPIDYGYSTTAGVGQSTWNEYFYYGGTACTPTSCSAQATTCGSISDGCGNTLQCGTCGAGDICSGGSCVCAPKTCPTGEAWNAGTCSCQVKRTCSTPATCCAMNGCRWTGKMCICE